MLKHATIVLLAVVVATSAWPAESRATTVPKPRVRLDPLRQTAIAEPPSAGVKDAPVAVRMDPVIVQAAPLGVKEPEPPKQNEGKFSLLSGGRIVGKDLGPVRVEVGFWPYIDVIQHDGFKAEQNHVGVDLLRVWW